MAVAPEVRGELRGYLGRGQLQGDRAAAGPALLVVRPSDPELVYFALEQRILGVNVPARTVLHVDDEPVNMPRPGQDPISCLYAIAWELPPQIAQGS